jgi:hypothetical protein
MNFFEDLIKYLESIIVLFTIPFAYLEIRDSKYEKLLEIQEQLAEVVLYRISNEFMISRHEINAVINSYLLRHKFSRNSILIDDVLDKVIFKIETNIFISKEDRRRLIERVIILRLNKRSNHLSYFRFLKNNKKIIITYFLLGFALVTLLFPSKWQVFQTLEQYKKYYYQIGISLLISVITFSVIRFARRVFNPSVFEGEPALEVNTFKLLPNYYNEHLFFSNGKEVLKFNLTDVIYNIPDKVVETDQGCLPFGMIKLYKKLRQYKLVFKFEDQYSLEISISKVSFVNGSIDLDKVTYKLHSGKAETIQSFYSSESNLGHILLKEDFISFHNNYGIEEGYKSITSEGNFVILDKARKLKGIQMNGVFWEYQQCDLPSVM